MKTKKTKKKAKKQFPSLAKLASYEKAMKEEAKKSAQEKVTPALKEAFNELKIIIPELVSVRWQQYTPYFADGDQCEFGVGGIEISTTELDDDGENYFDVDCEHTLTSKQETALEKLNKSLFKIEATLELAFGDHTEVTLSATGITIEECSDHD